MAEQENTQVAQQGYEAFGRGDIDGVLAICADDVEWILPGTVPWAGTFHGKQGVGEFFRKVGESVTFQRFEPFAFIAQGEHVVALIHITGTMTDGGGQFTSEDAHLFTIRDGKVAHFRVYTDTQAAADAAGGMA